MSFSISVVLSALDTLLNLGLVIHLICKMSYTNLIIFINCMTTNFEILKNVIALLTKIASIQWETHDLF